MAMKYNLIPISYRPVKKIRVGYVNKMPAAGEGLQTIRMIGAAFQADGFNYPRATDTFFDVIVRQPTIAAGATVTQLVFTQEEGIKKGIIRKIGYYFNTANAYFQVRATLLVNGSTPSNYIYKTIDPATGNYQGSFPTLQIGTIREPAETFILIPNNGRVEIRWINANTVQSFSGAVRLWGWYFGE